MTDQEQVDHIKRLDRLHVAKEDAFTAYLADSTRVNGRRFLYYFVRYWIACGEFRDWYGVMPPTTRRKAER